MGICLKNPTQKHPHRRGEDVELIPNVADREETPPQAWGRLVDVGITLPTCRNTPTGVGKTDNDRHNTATGEKHPHRRGEDTTGLSAAEHTAETPPQAWGRLEF